MARATFRLQPQIRTINLTFQGWHKAEDLPKKSGVYLVFTGTLSEDETTVALDRLVYIGESDDIHKRVSNHNQKPCWALRCKKDQSFFFAFALANETDRKDAEACMIHNEKPPCNTEFVDNYDRDPLKVVCLGVWERTYKAP